MWDIISIWLYFVRWRVVIVPWCQCFNVLSYKLCCSWYGSSFFLFSVTFSKKSCNMEETLSRNVRTLGFPSCSVNSIESPKYSCTFFFIWITEYALSTPHNFSVSRTRSTIYIWIRPFSIRAIIVWKQVSAVFLWTIIFSSLSCLPESWQQFVVFASLF